jgi:hypothetical protein
VHPRTLKLLQAADDANNVEFPPNFDWAGLRSQLLDLQSNLERIASRSFTLDDKVQDASFFGDLAIVKASERPNWFETVFGLRFSNFGKLFTTCSSSSEKLSPDVAARLVEAAITAGFVYVEPEALDEAYAGANQFFSGATWWERYFDYT